MEWEDFSKKFCEVMTIFKILNYVPFEGLPQVIFLIFLVASHIFECRQYLIF